MNLTGCDSEDCRNHASYEVYVKASRGARLRACYAHLADLVVSSFQDYEKLPIAETREPVVEIRQFRI